MRKHKRNTRTLLVIFRDHKFKKQSETVDNVEFLTIPTFQV